MQFPQLLKYTSSMNKFNFYIFSWGMKLKMSVSFYCLDFITRKKRLRLLKKRNSGNKTLGNLVKSIISSYKNVLTKWLYCLLIFEEL